MILYKILYILLMLLIPSFSSLPISFIGIWIQPGLTDLITINSTWFTSKGIYLNEQQDVKNKFIYYNEQTRCKRCILFISRHSNALQYRESECFDADDDNGRICGSITPDTVLYTLFRDNAESISCPFDQSWFFKKDRQICQPKAFHNCFSTDTFQISYNNQCDSNQDVIATCFAQFFDGNMNYIISRSINQEKFICFSYTKIKIDENNSLPNEVYYSKDETCRDLLTRESALLLNILPSTSLSKHYGSKVRIPEWIQGSWLSIGTDRLNTNTFHINETQIIMKINNNLKSLKILHSKQHQKKSIRIRAKSLEQCSSIFYCIKLVYLSSAAIELSIGLDEHRCKNNLLYYTLFKPMEQSDISCPQIGIYKSLETYRSTLPVSSCSIGLWTLSIGCEITNTSELILSSSCRHDIVPEVQVITSMKGICLASWRTDHRFQRTLVLYEKSKAFCLIQPLKSMAASWIFSESSCTNIDLSLINVENSFRYSSTCLALSSSTQNFCLSYLLLLYLIIQVLIYM